MNALSSAATHCKFEASDAASDELVLLRMLQVLQATLTSECGQVLSDEAVCEMMETGLSMCCQMRLTGKGPVTIVWMSRLLMQPLYVRYASTIC